VASTKQAALAKARQRRVALDQDRAARDSRVESAAADVYVLIEDRSAAEQAVQAANVAIVLCCAGSSSRSPLLWTGLLSCASSSWPRCAA